MVFEIPTDYALGPYGFSSSFYKKHWEVVKNDLMYEVIDFFLETHLPLDFVATTIVLTPKTDNPSDFSMVIPISLCSACYKIITKLLATRLAKLLPKKIYV